MTAKKILLYTARAAGSLAACALAFAALWRYEYLQQLTQIDNIIGMIPLAFGLLFAGCICALLWMPHGRRTAALAVCLAATSLLTAALFPLAVRGNWWLDYGNGSGEGAGPDLTLYSPFEEDTLAASLEEEAALHLAGELPVLDGATALYPLYAAFAQAVYEEEDYAAGLTEGTVRCTNTANAYEAIVSGEADIIFVAGPSEKQKQAAADAGAELVLTPIGREAFVFIVGKSNPVEGLSYQQIRNIYSGKTAHWRTLGWEEGGSIIAFQRPEGSGSQSGFGGVEWRTARARLLVPLLRADDVRQPGYKAARHRRLFPHRREYPQRRLSLRQQLLRRDERRADGKSKAADRLDLRAAGAGTPWRRAGTWAGAGGAARRRWPPCRTGSRWRWPPWPPSRSAGPASG